MNKHWLHIFLPVFLIYLLLLLRPGLLGSFVSPIITVLSALYLSYYLLYHQELLVNKSITKKRSTTLWVLFVLLSLISIIWAGIIYHSNPIDITKSDILPLLKEIYYTRFIHHEFVYAHVDGYDYVSWTPNYLPMHWLPFVPAFLLGFDPRWISIGLLLLSFGIYYYQLQKQLNSQTDLWIKSLLPFILLFTIFIKQTINAAHNVEMMIAAYYMILALGIQTSSRWLSTIGFTSTLLSRYMSAFYLPIDIYLTLKYKNKHQWLVYGFMVLAICGLYIFPFVLNDPLLFFKGASAYDIAALGEWKGQAWQAVGDKPYQLFQGFGFASLFSSFDHSDLPSSIRILKITLLLVMVLSIFILILLSKKFQNNPLFKTVSLFLLILIFTSFSLVPYNYLFWNILFIIPVLILPFRIIK